MPSAVRIASLGFALVVFACTPVAPPRDASTDTPDTRDVSIAPRDAALADATVDTPAPDAIAHDARTAPPDVVDARPPPPADLDGFVRDAMARGNLPGLAAAILRDGDVAWTGTFGMADQANGRAVDAHTLFPVASVSKTITLTYALRLVEQGRLDLDADVDTIAPFTIRHARFPDEPITTRMLLAHASGIVDNFATLGLGISAGDPTTTLEQFARGYVLPGGVFYDANANFGARPATTASYCNACLGITGYLLEAAGGVSFREATRTQIFEPLAMDGAGWFFADIDVARLAVPYTCDATRCTALGNDGYAYYPASSLQVSVTGLSRFVRMWIAKGQLGDTRVLAEASVDEALRVQYPDLDGSQGLTWSTHVVGTRTYWGHTGTTSGGSARVMFDPVSRRGLVLMVNSDAHLRARLGQTAARDAMTAILARMDAEVF